MWGECLVLFSLEIIFDFTYSYIFRFHSCVPQVTLPTLKLQYNSLGALNDQLPKEPSCLQDDI